jgi:hypothetical protein
MECTATGLFEPCSIEIDRKIEVEGEYKEEDRRRSAQIHRRLVIDHIAGPLNG